MIEAGLHTSVTGRALKNGYIHLSAVNIRDYSKDKHKHVDDYPYGGRTLHRRKRISQAHR